MNSYSYTVEKEHDGMSVGIYLKYIKGVSSKNIRSLKKYEKGLTLNGEHIRTIDKIKEGDIVQINPVESENDFAHSECYVEILYEDEDVIVYNKPPNMTCHPSRKHHNDTLGNVYAAMMAKRGEKATFRCINRLDKDTSGAVAVAKTQYAAFKLQREMKKVYFGITTSTLPEESGVIEGNILRIDEIHIKRMVHPDGQYSKTEYNLDKKGSKHSLYRFILHTGRTHQIRVHMSSIGYPLAGDELYGGDLSDMKRQALHCGELSFISPKTGESIVVKAPLPEDMQSLMSK